MVPFRSTRWTWGSPLPATEPPGGLVRTGKSDSTFPKSEWISMRIESGREGGLRGAARFGDEVGQGCGPGSNVGGSHSGFAR